jgi:hypothetical protein
LNSDGVTGGATIVPLTKVDDTTGLTKSYKFSFKEWCSINNQNQPCQGSQVFGLLVTGFKNPPESLIPTTSCYISTDTNSNPSYLIDRIDHNLFAIPTLQAGPLVIAKEDITRSIDIVGLTTDFIINFQLSNIITMPGYFYMSFPTDTFYKGPTAPQCFFGTV